MDAMRKKTLERTIEHLQHRNELLKIESARVGQYLNSLNLLIDQLDLDEQRLWDQRIAYAERIRIINDILAKGENSIYFDAPFYNDYWKMMEHND